MRAFVLAQIPDSDVSAPVAGDQLALVGVDNHVIDRTAMLVIALYAPTPSIPDLHRAVFGACHHPFALAMERDARDVARMPVECKDRVWVRGSDVVELDVVVSCCRQVSLVWGNA